MTRIRRINVSQVEGDNADNTSTDEIRPFGETAFYIDDNNKLTLMMFDGVRTHRDSKVLSPGVLYGSNADAGDGSGSDTIKLIPDAGLGTDQYIVVDPTAGVPGHIHLRAGGTQDASTADLYLGGEITNVRVSDTTLDVVITTNEIGIDPAQNSWTFDNTGGLTFPDATTQTTAWTGTAADLVSTTTASITTASNPNNGPFGGMVSANLEGDGIVVFGPAGGTSEPDQLSGVDLTRLVGGTITESGSGLSSPILSVTSLGNKLYSIQVEGVLATVTGGEGIGLTITVDPLSEKIWTFGTDGSITFPGGASVKDLLGETLEESVLILGAGSTIAENQRAARIGLNGAVSGVSIGAGTYDWSFTNDGSLTLPNDGVVSAGGSGGLTLGGNFDVKIIADYTDNNRTWTFNGSNGSVTFPDSTVQETAWAGGRVVTAPTASTGAVGDQQGDLAFSSTHIYYCIADYNQVGHQVTGADYLGRGSLNTNAFQLTKTADTLQITVGDVISDSDGGATSTVVTVSSDENYTYVGTGGMAYNAVLPLTFTSTDYVPGGNIWKRVAWGGDTW
jgi:hypothetical protein